MAANVNSITTMSDHNQDEVQKGLRSDAGIGFFVLDTVTEVLSLDSVTRMHYGLSPDVEVNAARLLECVHPDDRANIQKIFWDAERNKGVKSRFRVPLEDGEQRYLEMFLRVDSARCFHGILLDVTEAMEMQNTLASERERFEDIAGNVPGQFSFIDKEYRMSFMSNEVKELLKLNSKRPDIATEDKLSSVANWEKKTPVAHMFGEDVLATRKAKVDQALSGETVIWEDETTDPQGNQIFQLVTYRPKFESDGTVAGIFALRVDITDMRKMEDELRKAHENLLRSNTDLEQFAYVASHDLKAPLRAIQVLIEWLQEDLQDYEEGDVQENIGLLGRRAARLAALLDDLLAYSRAGRQDGQAIDIDLQEVVAEIADLMGQGDNGVVEWKGPSVPKLHTDHAALHQVVRNLINNAIKHHPGGDCRVRVSATESDELIEVTIEDNGDGIDPEFSDKVFKMFQTLKPRDEVEGSGMGLAIVKRLVNHHGGDIWFETPASGVGTAFKFTWRKNASVS